MTQGLINSEESTFLFKEKNLAHLLTITFAVIKHKIKIHVFAFITSEPLSLYLPGTFVNIYYMYLMFTV